LTLPFAWVVNKQAQRQNQLLETALRNTPFRLVDLYGEGKLVYAHDKNLYAADLFHPSATGYRLWAKLSIKSL
jgi:lysophospholipase L1-like esterase